VEQEFKEGCGTGAVLASAVATAFLNVSNNPIISDGHRFNGGAVPGKVVSPAHNHTN
jgi:hypothetical protein